MPKMRKEKPIQGNKSMIEGNCPDCNYEGHILDPITILTIDDEVIEKELQCPACWHSWKEKPGQDSIQTSLWKVKN
jgi:hypothetical protein